MTECIGPKKFACYMDCGDCVCVVGNVVVIQLICTCVFLALYTALGPIVAPPVYHNTNKHIGSKVTSIWISELRRR